MPESRRQEDGEASLGYIVSPALEFYTEKFILFIINYQSLPLSCEIPQSLDTAINNATPPPPPFPSKLRFSVHIC
jgi:hypothetical protein